MSVLATQAIPLPGFRTILLATDFSNSSRMALTCAASVAAQYGSKVYVLHVLPAERKPSGPKRKGLPETDEAIDWAEMKMGDLLDDGMLEGIACHALIERGKVLETVSAIRRSVNADLIVVSAHQHDTVHKLMNGSVAERIARFAPCPVLTIGPGVQDVASGPWRTKVFFATDFGQGSLRGLPFALSIAKRSSAQLLVFHALQRVTPSMTQAINNCQYHLEGLLPPDARSWCQTKPIVVLRPTVDGILKTAAEHKAQLIVMGVRRSSGIGGTHLPWSTNYRVTRKSHCPVLTVRS